jgi:sulfide:quinone oxidoreductase
MTKITIVGAGFGALTTLRELRRHKVDAEITVIAPRAELHYLPGSIWIPARLRNRQRLTIPLERYFARHGATFVKGTVTGLADGGRTVISDAGRHENDHLVIAAGGKFIRKLSGIEHAHIPCEGLSVAEDVEHKLSALSGGTIAVGFASNPNEQGAMRGGPMFEYLFIIDTLLRKQGRREKFELVFFSPAARPGQRLGDKAVDGLLAEMKRRGIKTKLGSKMVRFEQKKVVTEDSEFTADLILFMPGLTGLPWFGEAGLPLSPGGMIRGDAKCRVDGMDNVWVVGDSGSFPGPDWLPKQAHQADLQAHAAATNIASVMAGRQPTKDFKAELICIVDSLDSGILVYRTEQRSIVTPRMRLFHWAKRAFERHYLRTFA